MLKYKQKMDICFEMLFCYANFFVITSTKKQNKEKQRQDKAMLKINE